MGRQRAQELCGLSRGVARRLLGALDLAAELGAQTLQERDEVLGTIRKLEGVVTSETNLLLTTRWPERR